MNKEQKEIILDCLAILKGAYKTDILEKTDAEILDILTRECLNINRQFWELVDENKELKNKIEYLEF